MKHLCISKIFFWILFLTESLFSASTLASSKSAILYYGDDISWSMVGAHDYIIVEPEHIDTDTHGFKSYKDTVYAYVSLGEVDNSRLYFKDIKTEWIIGKNKAWGSKITDFSNPDYRKFMLDTVIENLIKRGFNHFFFDTLDSFEIVYKNKDTLKKHREGLATLIHEIHLKYPQSKLILNRGFEVFSKVKDDIEAVLFESYFYGLNAKLDRTKVSKNDRAWLDVKLEPIIKSGKDIIVVDYMENPHDNKAKQNLRKLQKKGFIPYITNKELDNYGRSVKEVLKREVLILYDGDEKDIPEHGAHILGALPLEYMGYIVKMAEISTYNFAFDASMRYAGVVVWLEHEFKDPNKLTEWIVKNQKKGLHSLFMGSFGFKVSNKNLSSLSVTVKPLVIKIENKFKITNKDKMYDFETKIKIQMHDIALQAKDSKKLLSYTYGGKTSTLAAITPWGGYALDESTWIQKGDHSLWTVNPFSLYREALRLPHIPVLDPTTENGLRLFFTHIDGDAIMNKAEFDPSLFSGEVIYRNILKKYKVPHTVSFVGGEIMPNGLYPKKSDALIALAKKIYALEDIEVATHTFSHPFKWGKIVNGNLDPHYRLDVPSYTFSLSYEFKGTLDFFENNLSSEHTRKPHLVLWTGDCLPSKKILKYVAKNNLLNMNGGDTTIVNNTPWLNLVAPYGIKKGDFYQIYTGAQNENIYTCDFTSPFWGFRKVIQTFELTNSPRRFKPVDIYYHFYAGSKMASLRALESVFDWAIKQELHPIFTSEYIPKVLEFYDASIVKENNTWKLYGLKHLRNIRFDNVLGEVDILNSKGIIGKKDEETFSYISLFGNASKTIRTGSKNQVKSHMITANAALKSLDKGIYTFEGYVPFKSIWYISKGCTLEANPKADKIIVEGSKIELSYIEAKKVSLYVKCQ